VTTLATTLSRTVQHLCPAITLPGHPMTTLPTGVTRVIPGALLPKAS
ncbi:hypothetical protein L195_g063040, partial [Trifolium pratense]